MKISEMSTEKARQVLCAIAAPVANIVGDKKTMDALARATEKREGETVGQRIGCIAQDLVLLLLGDHADDMYAIVAAMSGKTPMEVANQPILVTIGDVRGMVDKDLLDFFTRSAQGHAKK